jgi:hypothetical protein
MTRLAALFFLTISLHAQKNFDFEEGSFKGWTAPASITDFNVTWSDKDCLQGKGCVDIAPNVPTPKQPFGNLVQVIDPTPYLGKKIRFRAAVQTNGPAHAQLWFRIDKANAAMGFFDNMGDRPIRTQGQWQHAEINAFVNHDAKNIVLGVMAFNGPVRIDDASFTVTGELPTLPIEGPRPITDSGLRNLESFAILYGLIRHFHPSDQAQTADWNYIAIEGARKAESAINLAKTLTEIFQPIAPTVRIFTGEPPPPDPLKSATMLRYQHKGFGQPAAPNRYSAYSTKRIPAASMEYHSVTLPAGVKVIIPLAAYSDSSTTTKSPEPLPVGLFSPADRATRLGNILIAWNIFRHFYPYFGVAQTDWNAQLPLALKQAAVDANAVQFHSTLRKMVAALKDGHGNVYGNFDIPQMPVPIAAAWIENKLIVTKGDTFVHRGAEIVAINGKPAAARLAEIEAEISTATPQWARSLSPARALVATKDAPLSLTVRNYPSGQPVDVFLNATTSPLSGPLDTRPPTATAELEPGFWYIDLTRSNDKEFEALLPQLENAKGIVFDMRGYPKVSAAWFSHVSKTDLKSAQWHIPLIDRPGHMEFTRGGEWDLQPKSPYLEAKRIFLTNGRAISYAESTMGIVEAYKLGEIIGEATAGTNGNVNPFQLPGGYNVSWTGMKVIKHDGTRHHGVGIKPTIPMQPTQAGIAAGRDELLERALSILKQPK